MDLFSTVEPPPAPLAHRLRPETLANVVGQEHLLYPGSPLLRAVTSKRPLSFLFWGPPGVGKTTLASLIAQAGDRQLIKLSAVSAGVKEIRAVSDSAQEVWRHLGRQTVLFLDEVHRLSKAQQDTLLPLVEEGSLLLVASTTEHPGMEVNAALLSRLHVYELKPLQASATAELYRRATPHLEGRTLSTEALGVLHSACGGDGRRFLNLLEMFAAASPPGENGAETVEQWLSQHFQTFDKDGDQTYWILSAFHKSLRGSDPDAALYWMARLVNGGGDARHAARRMVAMAAEDIGLADPFALVLAESAAKAYDRLGAPEGELALAQAAVYLANAPKSNSAYAAWKSIKALVASDEPRPVPEHLRVATSSFAKRQGYGATYSYPHDDPRGISSGQRYLPTGLENAQWWQPTANGEEARLREEKSRTALLRQPAPSADNPHAASGQKEVRPKPD